MGSVIASSSVSNQGGAARCAPQVNTSSVAAKVRAAVCLVGASAALACGAAPAPDNSDTVQLGVLLPFTGREAALGRNIEQAMLLAVEDINAAGGVGGKDFSLVTRDSHSGSERGMEQLLELLYTDDVQYLIGPEENELANEIVRDIKALNIFNILPGYAAPNVERVGTSGAWMRLAPNTFQVACGMAKFTIEQGADTLNTLASQEDYNLALSTEVGSHFRVFGGKPLPSVTVNPQANSFEDKLDSAFEDQPERTVLIASPATGSTLVTEWTVKGKPGEWFLSPLLRADAFLLNVPFGSLNGTYGLSPSLSLASECSGLDGDQGKVQCSRDNSERFSAHFAERWDGAKPLAASRMYYDAVVLIAMGMRYGLAVDDERPSATRLHRIVRDLNEDENEPARWDRLKKAMQSLDEGNPLRYVGAGAEYTFDRYGAAQHEIYDLWKVKDQRFVEAGAFYAYCKPFL